MKDRQNESPVAYCCFCGCELYECDYAFLIDGMIYCEDCIESRKFEAWELENV